VPGTGGPTQPEELERARRQELFDEHLARRVPQRPVLVDYNPAWPAEYEAEAAVIRDALGEVAIRIEHVGSTAVPGLAAKPVIDIQVSVPSMDPDLYEEVLVGAGYYSVPDPENLEHHFFGKPWEQAPRSFNLHVCPAGSEWERRHIGFRDYLRVHPDEAKRYEEHKREMARIHSDTLDYADAKTEFIRAMERKAGLID
jgi:GrpB-like predicted nucleotidyltransferase (UPF0157 family)